MKSKILKYIIVSFFATLFLSIIMFNLRTWSPSVFDIYIYIWVRIILLIFNFLIFFINKKNYYFLDKILFFGPQLLLVIIFLTIRFDWKYSIQTCYIPFFIVQTFFYLKVRKMFSDLE